MPSHFVNEPREAGEIRCKAEVVRRYGPRDPQQPFDHVTPAIRTRQIEWMCVCEKPFERGWTFDHPDRWSGRIQSGIARDEVDAPEHSRRSRRHSHGGAICCGAGAILPVIQCTPARAQWPTEASSVFASAGAISRT